MVRTDPFLFYKFQVEVDKYQSFSEKSDLKLWGESQGAIRFEFDKVFDKKIVLLPFSNRFQIA